ncbi:MAG TPA: helix-turn-helix domain-containing protein [Nocardioidaceae bacterium]|nr:helix-turn-helix domain-containing protein [Nocardioidaceae bacterium]
MFDFIASGLPTLRHDEPLTHLARGTCLGMVELVLAMIEHGLPADRAEPPVVAVEYACLNAERGFPLGDLLRSFRLGHACFARILTDAIMALEQDPAELVNAVRESERFSFAVVDVVSSRIGAVYVEQCQRINDRTASQRRDVVRALLDNDSIDITRAEQSLGHRLTGPQLAFITWSDSDAAAPHRAVSALQETLNAPRPVLLPIDAFALAGWFDISRCQLLVDELVAAVGIAAPAAHVALGPVLPGLSGFRRSRADAERVRRVVSLSRRRAPTVTRWADVALVDALSADVEAARALVRHELKGLTRSGGDIEMLRHTAQVFVVSGYSYAAVASTLHIHRNTALQRVKKAEALRGTPLTERPAELLAALALIDTIGAALLES